MDHKTDCLVCGKELDYLFTPVQTNCFYCREKAETDVMCSGGHFVCDACHRLGAMDLIYRYCIRTSKHDPIVMATELMRSKKVAMHGPEHHFIVPAVLITAYYNTLGGITSISEKEKKLREALRRSEKVPGGFCGFYGACGAAIGTGIFISLVTGATPLARQEWMLSNMMTSRSLSCIAHSGGPRCCKRDTYIALVEAVAFIEENLNVKIEIDPVIHCCFHSLNRECLKSACPFYDEQV